MFDFGWSEMAVIALLALIVLGPKDLPKAMQTAAHWVRKARAVTREFQSGIDEMMRESELADAKKSIEKARHFNVRKEVEDAVDPTGEVSEEAKDLDRAARDQEDGKDSAKGDDAPRAEIRKTETKMAPGNSVKPPVEDDTGKSAPGSGESGQSTSAKPKSGKAAAAQKTTAKKTATKKTATKKTAAAKSTGAKSTGAKSTGSKSAGSKSTAGKSAGSKSGTGKTAAKKTASGKSTSPKSTSPRKTTGGKG